MVATKKKPAKKKKKTAKMKRSPGRGLTGCMLDIGEPPGNGEGSVAQELDALHACIARTQHKVEELKAQLNSVLTDQSADNKKKGTTRNKPTCELQAQVAGIWEEAAEIEMGIDFILENLQIGPGEVYME